jgi:hypothetical protein
MILLALLLGCPPKPAALPRAPDGAEALIGWAEEQPLPPPVASAFSIRIDTPDTHASAAGTLVVAAPGRFRFEVHGPIGGSVLVVACDGTSLNAWEAGKNRFIDGSGIGEQLRTLTGGVAGLDAVTALLVGRVPQLGKPTEIVPSPGSPQYTFVGPGGSRLVVGLDVASGRLASFSGVGGDGRQWLSAVIEPGLYPKRLQLAFLWIATTVDINFAAWNPVSPDPSAFTLSPPPGTVVVPLHLGPPPDPGPPPLQ